MHLILFLLSSTGYFQQNIHSLHSDLIKSFMKGKVKRIIAMFLVTSPIVINVPTRGLLAVETMYAIVQWLANLNIKRNMMPMFVNKKHRYKSTGPSEQCLYDSPVSMWCEVNRILVTLPWVGC